MTGEKLSINLRGFSTIYSQYLRMAQRSDFSPNCLQMLDLCGCSR